MAADEAHTIELGKQAWTRLRNAQTWADWICVGDALDVGRQTIIRECNATKGRRYNSAFGKWLRANELDAIDKTVRSRLFDCLEQRDLIEIWRATLTVRERLKLNHPAVVLRKWKAATQPRPVRPKATKPVTLLPPPDEQAPWPPSKWRKVDDPIKEADLLTKMFQRFPDSGMPVINGLRARGTDLREYVVCHSGGGLAALSTRILNLESENMALERMVNNLRFEIVDLKAELAMRQTRKRKMG